MPFDPKSLILVLFPPSLATLSKTLYAQIRRSILSSSRSHHGTYRPTENAWQRLCSRSFECPPSTSPIQPCSMREYPPSLFLISRILKPDSTMYHSFSAGKGTALVVDVGKDTASVTPVVDGFVLRKGG